MSSLVSEQSGFHRLASLEAEQACPETPSRIFWQMHSWAVVELANPLPCILMALNAEYTP